MAELLTLARPYSKAAFNFAVESQLLAEWENSLHLLAVVIENKKVARILRNPTLTAQQHGDILLEICNSNLDQTVQQFIRVLTENRRLLLLPHIAQLFSVLKAEHEKSVAVQVTSAYPLSDEQVSKLTQSLVKKLGKQIKIETEIDASLLGGVIIQANDLVIDDSIKGRLAKLSETLQG